MGKKSKNKDKAAETGKRAKNKEKTKKAILKAALATFAKKGFHEASTKEISKKAGIAEGTLFNYFRTKEDLALYFFDEEIERLIAWYNDNDELQSAPLAEKLFAITVRHLERVGPYEDFIGAIHLRALQPTSRLNPLSLDRKASNVRYLQFINEILRDAEETEEIPAVGEFGAYAFGLFQLAVLTRWLHDTSADKEETLAFLDRCMTVGTNMLRKRSWEW